MSMLEIRGLSKSFGTFALRGIDLKIGGGELWALLGPSGCGKTSLLRLIGGFDRPDAGEIALAGVRIEAEPPHRRACNMIFQRYALFPHLSVQGNIAFGLKLRKKPRAEIAARVREALQLVELEGFERRRVAHLSGGQQQRVAIARALVMEPKVLLLDEPLAALDLKLRQKMQVELKRLQRRLGITFILVTHDQDEALTLADRVCVMNHGVLEQVGSPQEVYDWPRTAFVADFIGKTNAFVGTVLGRGPTAGSMTVDVPGLGVFHPSVAPGLGAQLAPGSAAQVIVRPEHVRCLPAEEAAPPAAGDVQLRARVTDVLFKGADYELFCQPEDAGLQLTAPLMLRGDAAFLPRAATAVRLAFTAADARVVPRVP